MTQQTSPRPDHILTYAELAERAAKVRTILSARDIKVHRDSALSKMLGQAESLPEAWMDEAKHATSGGHLVDAANASRIAEAVIAVENDTGAYAQECLRRLASKPVNLSERDSSAGKDALWEIELLALLRRLGISAHLHEPPDLIADFGGGPYSFACKKIYSEKGVEQHLRKGSKQIADSGKPGVIAINIDDLVVANGMLRAENRLQAGTMLGRICQEFIDRHTRHMKRFAGDPLTDAVLVSLTIPYWIRDAQPNFGIAHKLTLWHRADAPMEKIARLNLMCFAMRSIFA